MRWALLIFAAACSAHETKDVVIQPLPQISSATAAPVATATVTRGHYRPRVHRAAVSGTGPDRDGDGIPDDLDKCPDNPEDFDGFQDEDGCPDVDNDGDGILDINDLCPNVPETFNGFEDQDGCPDTPPTKKP
jgi:hypothetical protein